MIKWLKNKIEIHNKNLDYGNYEDYWGFRSWLCCFICCIVVCVVSLYAGLITTFWKEAIVTTIGSILMMVFLCWQVELFSKSDNETYNKNEEDFDLYDINSFEFIWGIQSKDNLTFSEPSFYTMNDLEISYNKDTELYSLHIETIYLFNSKINEVKYLNNLLKQFTIYMKENNFDINKPFKFQWEQPKITLEAKTIPELYTQFRIFVEGYNIIYGGKGNEILCNI